MATDDTPFTVPADIAGHPAWHRLEDQRTYYSARAGTFQTHYKRIKLGLIGLSAAIPILAFMPIGEASKFAVAAAGVAIAVLEGLLLLNQYGPLWVKYRSTAEALKRERSLLLARAGEYKEGPLDDALRRLAERVETLLEDEHREWTDSQKKALEELARTQEWVRARLAEAQGGPVAPGPAAPAAAVAIAVAAAPQAAEAIPAAPEAPPAVDAAPADPGLQRPPDTSRIDPVQ